jgi:hypothetical protein
VKYGLLALAMLVGAPAAAAAPQPRLAELPGAEALPRVPPLAPPQPPVVETTRVRGTVTARELVRVGIGADGTPNRINVFQRLSIRSLGDYAFLIPAPVTSVTAAAGSESQPGLRPNQIVWQGFSPRRRELAAAANLRLRDSADALPVRIRVSGTPVRPGPFRLVLSVENATGVRVQTFAADAVEADVDAALDALRAAARIRRAVVGRVVRIRGASVPITRDVSAPFTVQGTIRFPAGSVRDVEPSRFSGVIGGPRPSALRVTVRGVALRPAAASVRVVADPAIDAVIPSRRRARHSLETAIVAYLRYARTRQYETFLANPDARGPSRTTYVFEAAAGSRPTARVSVESSDGSDVPLVLVVAGLALLGLGGVVLWAHL